jgi:hypothetical protein
LAKTKDAVLVVALQLLGGDAASECTDDGAMEVVVGRIFMTKQPLDVVEAQLARIQLRKV